MLSWKLHPYEIVRAFTWQESGKISLWDKRVWRTLIHFQYQYRIIWKTDCLGRFIKNKKQHSVSISCPLNLNKDKTSTFLQYKTYSYFILFLLREWRRIKPCNIPTAMRKGILLITHFTFEISTKEAYNTDLQANQLSSVNIDQIQRLESATEISLFQIIIYLAVTSKEQGRRSSLESLSKIQDPSQHIKNVSTQAIL